LILDLEGQVVFPDFVVDAAGGDAQEPRRLGLIALRLVESGLQENPFAMLE